MRHLPSIVALALLSLPLRAQHAEAIRVEVVDVPVYVTRSGKAVTGLASSDFELRVNGKPQPIEYFDVVDFGGSGPLEASRGAAHDQRQRRLFLLVFDLCFSRPHAVGRAQKAAEAMVDNAAANDLYAVATFTPGKGLQFVTPFSRDRIVVRRAIYALQPSDHTDPLRLMITPGERAAWLASRPGEAGESEAGAVSGEYGGVPAGEAHRDMLQQPARRLIENQVRDLTTAGMRLGQLQGHKHVIVLSEGFSASLVHGAATKSQQRGAPPVSTALLQAFESLYRHFRASDTFLHTVDIGGLRHGFDRSVTEAPLESLRMLSSGTGGQFVHHTNDLRNALGALTESHRQMYLLGFRSRNVKRGHNRMEVKVKNLPRGAEVSDRRGFSTDVPMSTKDALLLADIVLNDVPQTGFHCSLSPTADGIRIVIPANVAAALDRGEAAEVMLYVFDSHRTAVASRHLRVTPVAGKDAAFELKLELPTGRYVAKAILRVGDSLGVSRVELDRP